MIAFAVGLFVAHGLAAPQDAASITEARLEEVTGVRRYVRISAQAINEMRLKGWRATGEEAGRWMNDAVYGGDADGVSALLEAGADARVRAGRNAADRAHDGLADRTPNRTVRATGRRVDFASILKLLTDE